MKNIKKWIGWIVLGFIVLIGILKYNNMYSLDTKVNAQWANVENVYQRRADLIPNLVQTVKGYASHERETLEAVIDARSKATSVNIDPSNLDAAAIQNFQNAQSGLTSALSKLMVVVERYPELKANQNFLELQAQLEGSENRITTERKRFNDLVGKYNRKIGVFPNVIISKMAGLEKKGYFEANEGAEVAPTVSFE